MSFPERLQRHLHLSQCSCVERICPHCGSINCSRNLNQVDSKTFRKIPEERLNLKKTTSRGCKTIFFRASNASYAACLAHYETTYHLVGEEGVSISVYHSRWDEYICEHCESEFRLMLPLLEIPEPYIPEFHLFPCLFDALRKRRSRSP